MCCGSVTSIAPQPGGDSSMWPLAIWLEPVAPKWLAHRCVRTADRRVAGQLHSTCRVHFGCFGTSPSSTQASARPAGASFGSWGEYLSIKYTERLAGAKIAPSLGSVGDSYDNAVAETSNGLFKAVVIHRCRPRCNFEAVEHATLERGDWFDNRRLPEPVGNIPPAEAEANACAALERSDMAA